MSWACAPFRVSRCALTASAAFWASLGSGSCAKAPPLLIRTAALITSDMQARRNIGESPRADVKANGFALTGIGAADRFDFSPPAPAGRVFRGICDAETRRHAPRPLLRWADA